MRALTFCWSFRGSVQDLARYTVDPHLVCKITTITSNEAITPADAQITGNLTANLRAERLGSGTGRLYTLTVQCTDVSGNSATQPVTVTVPHDQGQ